MNYSIPLFISFHDTISVRRSMFSFRDDVKGLTLTHHTIRVLSHPQVPSTTKLAQPLLLRIPVSATIGLEVEVG